MRSRGGLRVLVLPRRQAERQPPATAACFEVTGCEGYVLRASARTRVGHAA
jgi:hypothetical protein